MKWFPLILCCVSVYGAVLPENRQRPTIVPTLPDIQKICANDGNIDQCIRGAVSDAVNRLYSEVTPLRVSLIDPLAAEGLRQSGRQNSPIRIYSNSHVTEVNVYFPTILVNGTQQADMQLKGSSTFISSPFNVPQSSQMPVLNSVLGSTLSSTGDFLLNLSSKPPQYGPEININQTPSIQTEPSPPKSVVAPVVPPIQAPVLFFNNKPKSAIVTANTEKKPNEDFVKGTPITPTTVASSQSIPISRPLDTNPESTLNTGVQLGSKFQSQQKEQSIIPTPTFVPIIQEEPIKIPPAEDIPELTEEASPSISVQPNLNAPVPSGENIQGTSDARPLGNGNPEINYFESKPQITERPSAPPAPTLIEEPSVPIVLPQPEPPIIQPISDLPSESDSQIDDTQFGQPISPMVSGRPEESPEAPKPRPEIVENTDSTPDFLLPSFVQPCDEEDPNFDRCIREAFWAIIPPLYKEVKPFQVRRLDPLNIDRAKVDYDSGYFQVAMNFEDAILRGMSQAEYRDIRVRISNGIVRADVKLLVPVLTLEGRYTAELDNNGLKLPTSGPFNVTMTDVEITQKWKGRIATRKDHQYLEIDEIQMIPTVDAVSFDSEDSVPDRLKNEIASTFLMQNWANIYKSFVRSTRSYWEPIMIVAVNDFLGRLPFDALTVQKVKPTSTMPQPSEIGLTIPEQASEPILPVALDSTGESIPEQAGEASVVNKPETTEDFAASPTPEVEFGPTGNSGFPPLGQNTPIPSEEPLAPTAEDKPESSVVPQQIMLPGSIELCNENDANFEQCIQESIAMIVRGLYNAIKPLQSAQIDPLIIPAAKINYTTGLFEAAIGLENLSTHGMSNAEYRDIQFKVDGDNVNVDLDLFFPQLRVEGNYVAKIQFKWLKVEPKGPFSVMMSDIDMKQNWKGHFVMRNGHKYVEIDEIQMTPEIGKVEFDEDALFPNQPRNDIIVNFLNGNWANMYKLLVPATRPFWEPRMKAALNQFLSGLPYDMLITPKVQSESTVGIMSPSQDTSVVNVPAAIEGSLLPSDFMDQSTSSTESSSIPSQSLPDSVMSPSPNPSDIKPIEVVTPPTTTPTSPDKPMSTGEFILPDNVKPCSIDKVDYDQCIRMAVYQIFPQLYNRLKPLQTPRLDPLYFENAHIDYDPGYVQVGISFPKISAYGMNNAELREIGVRIYDDRVIATVDLFYPKIVLDTIYDLQVQYNGLSFPASGPANVTMMNIAMAQTWRGNLVPKNGHKYLKLDSIEMTPEIGSSNFELSDILDAQRKAIAINFLNANWGILYKSFVTGTRPGWEPIMIDVINEFLENLPFDVLMGEQNNLISSEPSEAISSSSIPNVVAQSTENDLIQATSDSSQNVVIQMQTEDMLNSTQPTVVQSPASNQNVMPTEEIKGAESDNVAAMDNVVLSGETEAPIQIQTESSAQFTIPDFIQPCNELDENFNPCVREAIWNIIPNLFNEKNPFQSRQLNPLYIDTAQIEYNPFGSKKNITFEQYSTYGFNRSELRDIQLRVFSESIQTEVEFFFPRLFMEGNYKAEVEYSGLRLEPSGPFNITMNDVQMLQKWKGHFITKNQHKYLQLDEIKMTPTVGLAIARVEGVFDDQRSALVEDYLTRNWNTMFSILVPSSRSSWEPIMINVINNFLERLPLDFIKTETES